MKKNSKLAVLVTTAVLMAASAAYAQFGNTATSPPANGGQPSSGQTTTGVSNSGQNSGEPTTNPPNGEGNSNTNSNGSSNSNMNNGATPGSVSGSTSTSSSR